MPAAFKGGRTHKRYHGHGYWNCRGNRLLKAPSAAFVLNTSSGDHLHGVPVKMDQEDLHWSLPALGELSIPLRQVAGITRSSAQTPRSNQTRQTEDMVNLVNGDQVRGIVTDLSGKSIIVQSDGNPVTVPLDSVQSIRFAATGAATTSTGRAFRVGLADGSTLRVESLKLVSNELSVILPDKTTRQIGLANVAAIEQINGPVAWLSGLEPIENVQTPYLGAARPAQMDRAINGEPIRFGDQMFSRGIGVYPYSRLTWSLDGTYSALRTRYAIAGDGAYANVTVRIKLDGKVVREQHNVRAGVLSPVVLVPLGNAHTLTFEVDYGENLGVQDRFNWIEPALLKTMPTTRPYAEQ